MLLINLIVKKLLERLTKKNCRIKGKDNELYFKWKGCDSYFNNWIDKKRCCYIK